MSEFPNVTAVSEHAVCAMHEPVGSEEFKKLMETIATSKTVSRACFFSTSLDYKSAVEVAKMLKLNKALQVLDLSENYDIGDKGVTLLADALEQNQSVVQVSFENLNISNSGAHAIGKCLVVNKYIVRLNLQYNSISAEGIKAEAVAKSMSTTAHQLFCTSRPFGIGESLKINSTLKELNLNGNEIGSMGAESIGDALKSNTSLEILRLVRNGIGDTGAISLGDGLKENSSLQILELQNNEIGVAGSLQLLKAAAAAGSPIKKINLARNSHCRDKESITQLTCFISEQAFLSNEVVNL